MKGSTAALVLGILLILFGSVFALQGAGYIGGSVMTNNPFWIYAGSAIAFVGLILAGMSFWSRSKSTGADTTVKPQGST